MNDEYYKTFQQAINFLNQGSITKAESICKNLISINPNEPDIYNLLAIINDKKGNTQESVNLMEKAISIDRNNHLYYVNLGEFYKKIGDIDKSISNLKTAILLNPDFHGSKYNLANVYKSIGNFIEAEILYKEAISLNPSDLQSLQNLGNIYYESKNYLQATETYFKSYRLEPQNPDITSLLASCFLEIKNEYQAEYFYKTTLALRPNDIKALKSLSVLCENQSRFEEGIKYYKEYIEVLKKEGKYGFLQKLHLETSLPTFELTNYEIKKNREKIFSVIKEFKKIELGKYDEYNEYDLIQENVQIPSQLIYQGFDNKELKKEYAKIFRDSFPIDSKSFNTGKIKIGFLVTKNNEGIFTKFMSGIINNLDKNEFDIFIICDQNGWENKISKEINNVNTIFIPFNLKKSYEILKDISLDILYYWEIGNDSFNYFLPFFRFAPIQCTSIGWPETTGIDTVDYFISSELIEGENSESHYSEKLFKLKDLPFNLTKPILENNLKPLDYFDIDSNKNIYLCPQNLRKIQPDFDEIISGILNKDKNGVIVFISKNYHNSSEMLKLRLKITNPEIFDRVIFLEQLNYSDYLSLVSHSHVILDPLYFGGANTSYDIFSMARPIVTLPWTHERGRYTLGCYKKMGILDLIANNIEEYIDLSFRVANDSDFRNNIISKIKEKNHLLYNNKSIVQEYTEFFKKISRNN